MTPKIAFLAAAGPTIGGGHVVRSVSIANALAASGAVCTFFNSTEAITASPLLSHSGHQLVAVSQQQGSALAAAQSHAPFDWLVVDDYSLGAAAETPWRVLTNRILVVDDLANRAHDCDLLLDSAPARRVEDYAALVPTTAKMLLGAQYAPLRAEFAARRPQALAKRQMTTRAARLLVSFGLVDPGGIAAEAVAAICQFMPELGVDVVIGAHAPSRGDIERQVQANPHIALHVDPPSMPELMIACDVALGAGGSTAWERACLGLPSIAIILADNQRPFARELDVGGVLLAFEKSPDLWTHVLPSLSSLADGGPAWHEMSRKAADICDGLGARRIARTMLAP